MIRLAHLSDLHFGGENAAAIAGARDYINRGRFDLAVISGDVTRYGEKDEFSAAAEWLAGLEGARLVTPGNHDAPYFAVPQRLFAPFRRFEARLGPAGEQSFMGPGLAVRGR
jgi:3',5'-cyclic AMP phosphodiesterase CpdA